MTTDADPTNVSSDEIWSQNSPVAEPTPTNQDPVNNDPGDITGANTATPLETIVVGNATDNLKCLIQLHYVKCVSLS